MKNITLHILVLVFFGFFSGACKKQLNVYPTTQEVDGNVIVDAQSASTVLNGVYYQFSAATTDGQGVPSTQWYSVNEEIPSLLSGMLTTGSSPNADLDQHDYNPNGDLVNVVWDYGYAIVNAANGFLKNIEPVTTIANNSKNQMIAEAKFLRAFANSELLLYYGQYYDTTSAYGIIIRNEFVAPDNLYLPRSSVAQSYDSILADINNAIPWLPNMNSQISYANVWAAKLLEARVLMNRGSAADYAQVISLTRDIITNSPFSLETNVEDLFLSNGLTSNEVIMGIQPYPNQSVKWTDYISFGAYVPDTLSKLLFKNDPRSAWCIQTLAGAFGNIVALTKYYPGPFTNTVPAPITENGYAFRVTEAWLLEAEALVASGGSMADAKTLLETIEGHAGITDFTTVNAAGTAGELQLLIVEEEMKNFVAEAGQDWFALRRLPFSTVQSLVPTLLYTSQLILPIPQNEILYNSNIKQNPNY
jgi:starch-binding outer membrane protein, SusD/RagB family